MRKAFVMFIGLLIGWAFATILLKIFKKKEPQNQTTKKASQSISIKIDSSSKGNSIEVIQSGNDSNTVIINGILYSPKNSKK